jgi:HEAT repeat protein
MKKYSFFVLLFFIGCGISPEARAKTILEQGLEDPSSIVQINAAAALKSEAAKALLVDLLVNGEAEEKTAVLEVISQTHVAVPESLIIKACSSPNSAVREAAYQVIAQGQFTGARSLLLNGTRDDLVAVRVLSYGGLTRFNEVELVQPGMRDPDALVRIAAAKALGELGRTGMSEVIKEELKRLTPDLLGIGIITMAQLGDTASRSLFKALLEEGAGDLRVDAAEALLIVGDDTGVGALKNGLQSNDPFVRIRAVDVLIRHNVPETYAELEAATRDELMNVAVRAVKALSQHEPSQYRELFLELMRAQNSMLRIAAATAYLRSLDGA